MEELKIELMRQQYLAYQSHAHENSQETLDYQSWLEAYLIELSKFIYHAIRLSGGSNQMQSWLMEGMNEKAEKLRELQGL